MENTSLVELMTVEKFCEDDLYITYIVDSMLTNLHDQENKENTHMHIIPSGIFFQFRGLTLVNERELFAFLVDWQRKTYR